jgi:hypothetical protein
MRSILEKALIALLNEEKDKADALFHDFILERSRQIHESLRQGEDFVLDESWEQELSIDEMFSEADLAEEEEEEEVVAEGDDEFAPADTDAEEVPAEEVPAEEVPAEELPIEDRVSDLEAELQRLAAEFDAVIGGEELDGEVGGEMDLPVGDEVGTELVAQEDASEEDEEFASLEEGVVDTLEKVNVTHAEGQTTGEKVKVDTAARVKNIEPSKRQAGEPVKIKSDEHNGYDREAAPKTASMPKRRNVLSKGTEGQSGVKKEGDGSALLNKGGEDKSAQHSLFDKKRV